MRRTPPDSGGLRGAVLGILVLGILILDLFDIFLGAFLWPPTGLLTLLLSGSLPGLGAIRSDFVVVHRAVVWGHVLLAPLLLVQVLLAIGHDHLLGDVFQPGRR